MCGITGWIDQRGLPSGAETSLRRMNETLRHRGPDDAGYWASRIAIFGHTRLSVIDIEKGSQPMVFPAENPAEPRLILSYNGEIYNHRELRNQLMACGRRFHTMSDTEVLLNA
ncbi:hypothetical protein DCC24_05635 [Auritidibacter sp. NML100628]|nr:hypothetical protein DCC24_05635 [Auritidibacter sp. NML100628]